MLVYSKKQTLETLGVACLFVSYIIASKLLPSNSFVLGSIGAVCVGVCMLFITFKVISMLPVTPSDSKWVHMKLSQLQTVTVFACLALSVLMIDRFLALTLHLEETKVELVRVECARSLGTTRYRAPLTFDGEICLQRQQDGVTYFLKEDSVSRVVTMNENVFFHAIKGTSFLFPDVAYLQTLKILE